MVGFKANFLLKTIKSYLILSYFILHDHIYQCDWMKKKTPAKQKKTKNSRAGGADLIS